MKSKYEARMVCDVCQLEAKISDKLYEDILMGEQNYRPLRCGHAGTKILAKMRVKTEGWRMCYGSTK